jgi:predicted TIM-barrel fold metal-dependent hydrolase
MTRLIDVHVHAYPTEVAAASMGWLIERGITPAYDGTIADYPADGPAAEVIVTTNSRRPGKSASAHEWLVEEIDAASPPARAWFFPDPHDPANDENMAAALRADRCAGIKLHPPFLALAPTAAEMEPVYEAAATAGKPILMHVGLDPEEYGEVRHERRWSGPAEARPAIEAHPQVTFLLAHLAGVEVDFEAACELAELPNVWTDTALVPEDLIAGWVEERGGARILFGSDFPVGDPAEEWAKLLRCGIGPEEVLAAQRSLNLDNRRNEVGG